MRNGCSIELRATVECRHEFASAMECCQPRFFSLAMECCGPRDESRNGFFVPLGHSTIARRFNGWSTTNPIKKSHRDDTFSIPRSFTAMWSFHERLMGFRFRCVREVFNQSCVVPGGTLAWCLFGEPTVETVGYYRVSPGDSRRRLANRRYCLLPTAHCPLPTNTR